jgi:hypothetical protein
MRRPPVTLRARELEVNRSHTRERRGERLPQYRTMKVAATLNVNRTSYRVELDPHTSLLDAVRNNVGPRARRRGDDRVRACTCLDDKPVNACSYLALQAEGREVIDGRGSRERGRAA